MPYYQFKEKEMTNIRIIAVFITLLVLITGVTYAQTLNEVETQINQSIQRNQNEFERLQALQRDAFSNRQIALLQRQHNTLRSQIITIQREIETLITRSATRETINSRMRDLQDKMREEEALLKRLEALKG